MNKELSKKSICRRCVHLDYDNGIYTCGAFPPFEPYNGIPQKYLSGEKQHTQEDNNQFTKGMVFQDKEPYPML